MVLASGTTVVSLSETAHLVHSGGSVNLGDYSRSVGVFNNFNGSFTEGFTLYSSNDLVTKDGVSYYYTGSLPVVVSAGTNPISDSNWKVHTDPELRDDLANPNSGTGSGLVAYSTTESVSDAIGRIDSSIYQNPLTNRSLGGTLKIKQGVYDVTFSDALASSSNGYVVQITPDSAGDALCADVAYSSATTFRVTIRNSVSGAGYSSAFAYTVTKLV